MGLTFTAHTKAQPRACDSTWNASMTSTQQMVFARGKATSGWSDTWAEDFLRSLGLRIAGEIIIREIIILNDPVVKCCSLVIVQAREVSYIWIPWSHGAAICI